MNLDISSNADLFCYMLNGNLCKPSTFVYSNHFNVGIIVCKTHLKRVVVGVVCEQVDHKLWSVPGVWSTHTEG